MVTVSLLVLCCLADSFATEIDDMSNTIPSIILEEIAENRIIGGTNAPNGAFPHQVSLRLNNDHLCGGSVIDETTVLTAAHCIDGINVNSMTAVVGTNSLSRGGTPHTISRLIVHPGWNTMNLLNDIGIVKLSIPITFNSRVKAINLTTAYVPGQKALTISGWGYTNHPSKSLPDLLQFVRLYSISNADCAMMHAGIGTISGGQICTLGKSGKGVCMGDSGGPLIDQKGDQVGVVSWGIPCGRNKPDVFTRVSTYLEWVRRNQ